LSLCSAAWLLREVASNAKIAKIVRIQLEPQYRNLRRLPLFGEDEKAKAVLRSYSTFLNLNA
jgi:hypothetical protein